MEIPKYYENFLMVKYQNEKGIKKNDQNISLYLVTPLANTVWLAGLETQT
jgi:hypothetical protein